jgi:hypothetical protein
VPGVARPGQQFLSNEQYNQLFTMHGTVMLLYATPILFGFANYVVPLQIGSPDVLDPAEDPLGEALRCLEARVRWPSGTRLPAVPRSAWGKPEHWEVVDPRPDAVEDAGAAVRQDQPRVRVSRLRR